MVTGWKRFQKMRKIWSKNDLANIQIIFHKSALYFGGAESSLTGLSLFCLLLQNLVQSYCRPCENPKSELPVGWYARVCVCVFITAAPIARVPPYETRVTAQQA